MAYHVILCSINHSKNRQIHKRDSIRDNPHTLPTHYLYLLPTLVTIATLRLLILQTLLTFSAADELEGGEEGGVGGGGGKEIVSFEAGYVEDGLEVGDGGGEGLLSGSWRWHVMQRKGGGGKGEKGADLGTRVAVEGRRSGLKARII